MVKKLVSIILSVCLLLSLTPLSTLACENSDNYCSAINEDFLLSADIQINQDTLVLSRTYQNTNVVYSSNSYDSYVKEVVFLIPNNTSTVEDVYNKLIASNSARSSGNKTETELDSSISVEGHIAITYDRTTINNVGYVKLTNVAGGYRILDDQVRVNSQYINAGCSGMALGPGWVDQSDNFSKTTSSWTYTAPSNWYAVSTNNGISRFVGANCTYTLQRVGSSYTWELYLENNL